MSELNKYVSVTGNLLGYNKVICQLLLRYDINSIAIDSTCVESPITPFFKNNDFKISCINEAISKAQLNISLGPSILYEFGLLNSCKHFILNKKKVAFITQGSDITEFINENTIYSKIYRYLLRNSAFNLFSPYTHSINNILRHKIDNLFLSCHPHKLKTINCKVNNIDFSRSKLVFFHCSNLDWGETDNKKLRNSTKGNDKFLKALCKLSKNKFTDFHCHILDRGPDREIAKKIIIEENLEEYFTWHPSMDTSKLQDFISSDEIDIVVDQFDVGGLGGIACEAMSQAKPVMIYMDNNCCSLIYSDPPPVINCHTEEEIYNAIMEWSDRKKLQKLGEKAEKWVRKYHDVHTADFSEFILRVCIAAGLEWPRQDLAKSEGDL